MERNLIELLLGMGIAVAGAAGYVHGSFASKEALEGVREGSAREISIIKKRTVRTDSLVCKMAIREKLNNAVEMCSRPIEE